MLLQELNTKQRPQQFMMRRQSVVRELDGNARRTSHMWLDDVVDQDTLLKQGGDGRFMFQVMTVFIRHECT